MNKDYTPGMNYFTVDSTIRDKATEEARKSGYELMNIMRLSNHLDDQFLYSVLAYRENAIEGYQYVNWIYNGRGLDNGYYASTFKEAMLVMTKRLNDVEFQQVRHKAYDEIETLENLSLKRLLNTSPYIYREINGIPTKIELSDDEIYQLKKAEHIIEGYNILSYYAEETELDKKNAENNIYLHKLMNDKEMCLKIYELIEDELHEDIGSIERDFVYKEVKREKFETPLSKKRLFKELVRCLEEFANNYDYYNYMDEYPSREDSVSYIEQSILSNLDRIKESLDETLEHYEGHILPKSEILHINRIINLYEQYQEVENTSKDNCLEL